MTTANTPPFKGTPIEKSIAQSMLCYHCHDEIPKALKIQIEDKNYCCEGCKTVYEILNENNLCTYYDLDANAGLSQKGRKDTRAFDFLNDPSIDFRFVMSGFGRATKSEIRNSKSEIDLVDFQDETTTKVTFLIPAMHCASCIWLLEYLYKINSGILNSKVNFLKKEVYILFDNQTTTLREVAVLLHNLGYTPEINLNDIDGEKATPSVDRSIYYKLGVAGFSFGNIMLFSFPEYFGLGTSSDKGFVPIFGYINLILATPVLLYSAQDYFKSAWRGITSGYLNLDVPLAIGAAALYGRSAFEILTHTGAGFMDSFASLIFLLLTGKWFQQKTFYHLSFERDYKSYFPISATLKLDKSEQNVALNKLERGDIIIIKNQEIIPADGILLRGSANIDYSFVTGEEEPVRKKSGEKVFAGGRQVGEIIEVSLTRKVSQSYLTQLWNNDAFKNKNKSHASILADKAGRYFTGVILLVAMVAIIYWLPQDMGKAINAATAVLIIACPCAVALSIPFTLGNILRIFGRHEFYLKNTHVIEAFDTCDAVVFDKTGTITNREKNNIQFLPLSAETLTPYEEDLIKSITRHSNHPLSNQVFQSLENREIYEVENFKETIGQGIEGNIHNHFIKIGSQNFINSGHQIPDVGEFPKSDISNPTSQNGNIFVEIDGVVKGSFQIKPNYRKGFETVLDYFKVKNKPVYLLSGDNEKERSFLQQYFNHNNLNFQQNPTNKLDFIKNLQSEGSKILMIGDGLNDAGALKQSDVGIVISENTNNFSPACDGILKADKFKDLPQFLELAKAGSQIVNRAYFIAFCYNIVGLSYAVSGHLQPVIAAILMPLSSVTIVLFGVLSGNYYARTLGK